MSGITMRNRLLVTAGVLITGLGLPVTAHAAPPPQPPSVAQFLGEYFSAVDRVLLPGRAPVEQLAGFYASGSGSTPESATLARYERGKVDALHRWVSDKRDVYTSIATTPTIDSFSVVPSGQQASVEVSTTTTMLWSPSPTSQVPRFTPEKAKFMADTERAGGPVFGPHDIVTSIVSTRHDMRLVQQNGTWRIQADRYRDPFDQTLSADHVTPATEAGEAAAGSTEGPALAAGTVTYGRSLAVSYADTYALKYNKKVYVDYGRVGGDCTNFVSQALGDPAQGAALPFEKPYWYYTYGDVQDPYVPKGGRKGLGAGSVDWINSQHLHEFVTHNPNGAGYDFGSLGVDGTWTATNTFDKTSMMPGDPHFYDWDSNGVIDHAAIAVAELTDGTTLIDAHTNDRYHVRYDFGTSYDTATRYVMDRMNDTITVP